MNAGRNDDYPFGRMQALHANPGFAGQCCSWRQEGFQSGALRQVEAVFQPANVKAAACLIGRQMVLDERARELYWEGHRRTDLIRYDQLTTGEYLWPWKGGVANGTSVDAKYNLYPIPNANRASNPNLTQNPGF